MKTPIRSVLVGLGAAAAVSAFSQAKSDPGQLSGTVFGDMYNVSQHHDPAIKDSNGLWFRRIYLTYDKKIDEKFSARLRLEANSPGDFKSDSTLETFFKDVYLQYNGRNYRVQLGLLPTPSTEFLETSLGYRAIEKTPLDLFRLRDSRDQGIAIKGTNDDGRFLYAAMYGNASGTRGKSGKGNALYGMVGFKLTPDLTVEASADYLKKDDGAKWRTLEGSLVYHKNGFTGAVTLAGQRREPSGGGPSTDIRLTSFYADYQLNEKTKPYVRLDVVNDLVPGADKIAYLALSPDGKPTMLSLGVSFKVGDGVYIIPNIESVSYRQVGVTPKPSNDLFLRLTFSWTVK